MTERQIQDDFDAWLRQRGIPFLRPRMDQKSTIARGWPDFTICYQGRCLFIECKTVDGKLSPKQVAKIKELEVVGCPVTIARSLQECVSAVQTWLEGKKAATEAPVSAARHPSGDLRIVQWQSIDAVIRLRPDGINFVRLARPDDLLSIPRA